MNTKSRAIVKEKEYKSKNSYQLGSENSSTSNSYENCPILQ